MAPSLKAAATSTLAIEEISPQQHIPKPPVPPQSPSVWQFPSTARRSHSAPASRGMPVGRRSEPGARCAVHPASPDNAGNQKSNQREHRGKHKRRNLQRVRFGPCVIVAKLLALLVLSSPSVPRW
jgi:hypothetical protein